MTDAEFDQYIELTPEEESLRDEDFCAYCNTLHRLEGSFKNLIRRSLPEAMALKQKALGLFRASRYPAPAAPPPPPRPATPAPATTFQPAPVMTVPDRIIETEHETFMRRQQGMAQIQGAISRGDFVTAEQTRRAHDAIDRRIAEDNQPSAEELRAAFVNSIIQTAAQHRR